MVKAQTVLIKIMSCGLHHCAKHNMQGPIGQPIFPLRKDIRLSDYLTSWVVYLDHQPRSVGWSAENRASCDTQTDKFNINLH